MKKELSPELLDRQPPCNLDAEMGLLGSILLDPQVIDDVAPVVRVADFFDDANGRLFEHLVAIHNDGSKIDRTLLTARLKNAGDFERIGGAAYLARVSMSVPYAAHANYYADIVRRKALRRAVIDAGAQIIQEGYDERGGEDELLARAESTIFQLAERRVDAVSTHTAKDVMRTTLDTLEARRAGSADNGLATGFTEVDQLTGGLKRAELSILAARPSVGKSAYACNIATNAAVRSEIPVLFISLEMSTSELGDRLLAAEAQVDLHHIQRGTYTFQERAKLVEAGGRISNSSLFIDDSPTRNMTSIAALSRRHKRKHDIGLIVIDYLQLIDPESHKDPRQEQVAKITRRLKVLAREIQVPVLCLAQLNRQSEQSGDHIPKLSHLRESGAIEQDADVVMFVHRPGYYSRENVPSGQGEQAEIIVAKQRNGPRDTAKVLWFGSYCRFDNQPQFDP
jgi:replicative DNA helicase